MPKLIIDLTQAEKISPNEQSLLAKVIRARMLDAKQPVMELNANTEYQVPGRDKKNNTDLLK